MPKLNIVEVVTQTIRETVPAVKSVTLDRVKRQNGRLTFTAIVAMSSPYTVQMHFTFADDGVKCDVYERHEDDAMWGHMDQIEHIGPHDIGTIRAIASDALWYCG